MVRPRRCIPHLPESPSGGKLVADDLDLSSENTLLLGEPEDLFLEGLAVSTGLGPHRLTVGPGFGSDVPQLVTDGPDLTAYAGDAGEGECGQGDAHPENGESFLAESGHVGAAVTSGRDWVRGILPRCPTAEIRHRADIVWIRGTFGVGSGLVQYANVGRRAVLRLISSGVAHVAICRNTAWRQAGSVAR